MRSSPPAWFRHKQAPSDADRAQAATFADLLTAMITDGEERLSALYDAANRAELRDLPRSAYRFHRQATQLRRDLAALRQMDNQLRRRFPDTRCDHDQPNRHTGR